MNRTTAGSGLALVTKVRRPMSTVILLGIALMLVWAASLSTASADQHGEEASYDDNKQCIISLIGFAPDNLNDLTDDQRDLIKEQCSRESESDKAASVALKQCVIDTVGFLPADMSELTPEQLQLVGQECANPGQRKSKSAQQGSQGGQRDQQGQGDQGSQGGQQGSDIDPVTEECIIRVLGYMPEGPEDMTEEQKIALGQECFGHNQQRQGPPPTEDGGLDEVTPQCILDTLGFMPEGKDEITQEQMIMIGEACFGGARQDGGQRGPGQGDGPDEETLQCITEVLGFLPERPEELTPEQHSLIGRECFQGQGQGDGGPGDLTDDQMQCVMDVLGFLPERPEDLTDQQRMDLGRACFSDQHGGPPPDDENTQCIIDVLGYLPAGPEEVSPEQMALLGEACFSHERDNRGDRGGRNEIDEATNQCIIDILGFLPEHPEDLTYDEKSRSN